MSTLAVEINDAGIAVASKDGLLAIEPGYALREGSEISTGIAAYRQSRRKPQQVSNRYWVNLSMEASGPGCLGDRNTAELAYFQLKKLWDEYGGSGKDAILVVPHHYGAEHLGLLLGLAQECGMNVRAMIDSAVAATLHAYPGRQLIYLDAGLHRVNVSKLSQGEEVTLAGTASLENTGLASVFDALAKRIAEVFVMSSRFDPMHDATTEQLLFDRLPQWLDELRELETIEVSLPFDGAESTVEIGRAQLLAVLAGFYRAIVQLIAQSRDVEAPLVVQVSHRLARLPGLTAELARLDDVRVVVLPEGHATASVLARLADLVDDGGGVKLLKHLPWHGEAEAGEEPEPEPRVSSLVRLDESRRPTHIVYRGIAYAVESGKIVVGRVRVDGHRMIVIDEQNSGVSRTHFEVAFRNGELLLTDMSRYGTFVNERRVSGELSLKLADVIRVGTPGAELHVITVENVDEA